MAHVVATNLAAGSQPQQEQQQEGHWVALNPFGATLLETRNATLLTRLSVPPQQQRGAASRGEHGGSGGDYHANLAVAVISMSNVVLGRYALNSTALLPVRVNWTAAGRTSPVRVMHVSKRVSKPMMIMLTTSGYAHNIKVSVDSAENAMAI